MLSNLSQGDKVVGVKQTRKSLKDGVAVRVFVADDAEMRVIRPIIELCSDSGVELVNVPTMAQLGAACGIEVGAACAAQISR